MSKVKQLLPEDVVLENINDVPPEQEEAELEQAMDEWLFGKTAEKMLWQVVFITKEGYTTTGLYVGDKPSDTEAVAVIATVLGAKPEGLLDKVNAGYARIEVGKAHVYEYKDIVNNHRPF